MILTATRLRSVAALLIAVFMVSACGQLPTYRYEMSLEVETPESLRTGSSVIEVRTSKGSGFPGPEAGGIGTSVEGEAVMIDLGSRGKLFALLYSPQNRDYAAGIAPSVLLPVLIDRRGTAAAWGNNLRALKKVRGSAALNLHQYPLLVRFRDIRDPRTVVRVLPNDLASHFGPGVRLRGINIQISEDPITQGIASHLPWWEHFRSTQFDGDPLVRSKELANNLNRLAFKQEH
ncbi:MAG TPA: hypothetical protein VFG14_04375 [Chthoniobacteraceae bacterium]|nr:hypothetical protein [Chthoniobacteraceae bacterium]